MTELFVNAFIQIRVWDILDVLLVGLLFYGLYYLVKGTTAIKIFFGIVAWSEKSAGYLVACLWVIIAMISHFRELERA